MRVVAFTDVFQFTILIVAIPLACSFAYREAGGHENIMSSLPKEMLSLNLTKDNIWLFLSLIFYSLLPQTARTFVQRFLLSRDSKQLVRCIRIVAALNIFFILMICLIGFFIRAQAPEIDPNTAFI
ncbi:MAG: hypothetical protein MRQ09_01495 [Candidatus Midichloria sp.]|nr:hypothetical protein [Candidatus Midichloria sp.]